jgi:iron complex outermembrane recepter protein
MKRRYSAAVSIFLAISLSAGGAGASDTEKTTTTEQQLNPGPGEVFMNIGRILIEDESTSKSSIDLPGSVDILGKEQLSQEVTGNALELLRRIPGFIYSDYGNGGVPSGFSMRGFNSNHGSDNLVIVDGIPINDHFWMEDGAPDFNQLTSEEIDRIDVIKGPIDARYGNWARAGIVNIETRTRGDFIKSKLSYGSWNTEKAYVSAGSEHADHSFNQIYSVESYKTDGWRENSDQNRQNAYGKWYYRPTDILQVGMQVHVYQADWSTGSYIGEKEWIANPRQAYASSMDDGGEKELAETSLHLDWQAAKNIPVETRIWYKDNTASRYADWGSGQTESYCEESVVGIVSNIGYLKDLASDSKFLLDGGFDFRSFNSNVQDWQTSSRSRQLLNSDDDYLFNNLGLYAKANYDPFKYVRLFTGIRHDNFTGDTTNLVTDVHRDMDTYDVTTYKGGIIGNISDRYSIYANAGTTYTLPKKDLKYLEDHADVNPMLFTEVGFKANPINQVVFRYAFYNSEEDVQREIKGIWVDEGNAIRKGHEIELNILPFKELEIFSALTLDNSKFDGGENDGNWITSVPEYIWKVGLQYEFSSGTGLRLNYLKVGRWYTDTSNEHSYGGYETTDIKVYQKFAQKWTLSFDVKNLTDENYCEFVGYWSGTNQYMSSNPRAFYLTLSYDL